jgi:hypothetical protein
LGGRPLGNGVGISRRFQSLKVIGNDADVILRGLVFTDPVLADQRG